VAGMPSDSSGFAQLTQPNFGASASPTTPAWFYGNGPSGAGG
jgi:hypothetical protein